MTSCERLRRAEETACEGRNSSGRCEGEACKSVPVSCSECIVADLRVCQVHAAFFGFYETSMRCWQSAFVQQVGAQSWV